MRVGLDTFSLRDLKLDPFGQLDWIRAHGFEGAQFGGLGTDRGRLREIRARADALGLYSHVSVASPNPALGSLAADELVGRLTTEIEAAAAAGWHELHTSLGSDQNRYRHPSVPWPAQVAASVAVLQRLAPGLRAHASRLNLETHFDATTFELVEIADRVGPDVCGICLDTANVVLFGEHPLEAARRAAPYTHLTHLKDCLLCFGPKGLVRQSLPPGRGQIDWGAVLAVLGQHQPGLPLSIEDHKWLFGAEIFEEWWHAEQRHLTRRELALTVALAWKGTCGIREGSFPDPETYEKIPHLAELEDRLQAGRDHLRAVLAAAATEVN